jgi:glycosyltransferase involved in cell wall biosynthesis
MRIAIVSTPFVPVPPIDYGGTELIVAELCLGLRRRGHEVTLFTCRGSRLPCDVRARRHASWPPDVDVELDHAAWSVAQILDDSRRFDVVHAHVPSVLSFAQLVEAPLVLTMHHDRDAPSFRAARTLCSRTPARLVCVSSRQRALSPELACAQVIPHGLDPSRYAFSDGAGGYVAYLGRFSRVKGVHHALDAARLAGVRIVLHGAPHENDRAYFVDEVVPRIVRQRRYERAGARLLGPVGGADKAGFLRQARALLFPIEWEEPFGLVMIEAMLCGTPVIAFSGGAVEEVIEEGVTGFVVRDVGEMAARIGELDRFDRVGCWRRACERWSAHRMVADHLHLYRELARGTELDERRRAAAPVA